MSIAVVQFEPVSNGGNLPDPVAAGDTLFVMVIGYNFSTSVISTSAPTLGGEPVSGASLLVSEQNPAAGGPSGGEAYTAIWMLPDCPAANGIATTASGGNVLDLFALEASGLGPSPVADQVATNQNQDSASLNTGLSPPVTGSPELVLASAALINVSFTPPGTPWISKSDGSGFGGASYQIISSSGGRYEWTATGGAANSWAAALVTVRPTSSTEQGSASFTGSAALSAPGVVTRRGSALFSGASVLTAPPLVTRHGNAALGAGAGLAASGLLTRRGAATMAAAPSVAAAAHNTARAGAALAARSQLTAAPVSGPDPAALWDVYQAAAAQSSAAWRNWRMMRSVAATDGTAGFLYRQAYDAQQAADAAYQAYAAAHKAVYPGAAD